jgi:hypothetical protein
MVSEKEITEDWERICKEEMAYLQKNIGEMNRIREDFSADWEVEELRRAIIHDQTQIIEKLREEIEDARKS